MANYIVTYASVNVLADVVPLRPIPAGEQFEVVRHAAETRFGVCRCAHYLRAVARGKYDSAPGMPVKFFKTYT